MLECINSKPGTGRGATWAMALALAVAQAAMISPAGALALRELDARELAAMRGKYVSRGNVQYFGLTLSTRIVSADFSHNVEMNTSLDFSGDEPVVHSTLAGTLGDDSDQLDGARQQIEATREQVGGVSETVNGAVQSIQVEGDGNRIHNGIALEVLHPGYGGSTTSASETVATDTESTTAVAVAADSRRLTTVTQTPRTFDNGGVVTAVNDGNSLGYSIQAGDSLVIQQLGKNELNGARQLLQSVQLQGNAHEVVNTIRMRVGFAENRELRASAVRIKDNLLGLM